jgi:hypothetical protein
MADCIPIHLVEAPTAALIAATLATIGWLYTARRARTLSRKQHTINVILQSSFNKDFSEACVKLIALIKNDKVNTLADGSEDREAFRLVANHYEFLSAGIRNGDFDEQLMKDCLRAQLIEFYSKSADFIWKQRDNRRRQAIYEHLEWLYVRWEKSKPRFYQRWLERVISRPLQGRRRT